MFHAKICSSAKISRFDSSETDLPDESKNILSLLLKNKFRLQYLIRIKNGLTLTSSPTLQFNIVPCLTTIPKTFQPFRLVLNAKEIFCLIHVRNDGCL